MLIESSSVAALIADRRATEIVGAEKSCQELSASVRGIARALAGWVVVSRGKRCRIRP
jgi:hypothetical protein